MNAGSFASIRFVRRRSGPRRRARNSAHVMSRGRSSRWTDRRRARDDHLLDRAGVAASASSTIDFERDLLALAEGDVGGEDEPATRSRDPVAERRAPKPAKTTEWIAPMRTVASISTIASGQVGM